MTSSSMPYDLATVRELLLAAFTSETLRRFCSDRSVFRPVVDEFARDHGRADMVDEVLEYCRTQLLWDELLAEVQQVNPRQYRLFEPQLCDLTDQASLHTERPIGHERAETRTPLDLSEIAAEAVAVLSAYLAQVDEGRNAKVAAEPWEKAAEIHHAIKVRFSREKDDFSSLALRRFEEMPEKRKGAMEEVLEEILENDPAFASSLNDLLREQRKIDARTITQHVEISDHAQMDDIVQIGSIRGSVDLDSIRQAADG